MRAVYVPELSEELMADKNDQRRKTKKVFGAKYINTKLSPEMK